MRVDFEVSTIDHVGAPIWDATNAVAFFQRVGVPIVHDETVDPFNIHAVFLTLDSVFLEFLKPTGEGPAKAFLEHHMPGFQHLAYRVPDIDASMAELGTVGIRLRTDEPVTGVGDSRVVSVEEVHTAGFQTTLIERTAPVGGKE